MSSLPNQSDGDSEPTGGQARGQREGESRPSVELESNDNEDDTDRAPATGFPATGHAAAAHPRSYEGVDWTNFIAQRESDSLGPPPVPQNVPRRPTAASGGARHPSLTFGQQGHTTVPMSEGFGAPSMNPYDEAVNPGQAFGQNGSVQQSAYAPRGPPPAFSQPRMPLNLLLQPFAPNTIVVTGQPAPAPAPVPASHGLQSGQWGPGGSVVPGAPSAAVASGAHGIALSTPGTNSGASINATNASQAQGSTRPQGRYCYGHPIPGHCCECWQRGHCNHEAHLWCDYCSRNRPGR